MNKRNLLAICLLTLISISASAQFRKPLTSPCDRVQSSEARLNVGLLGGGNLTTWLHFDRPEASSWYLANYKPNMMNSLGFFGGIAIEYMTGLNHSLGLNVIYTQRNMALRYTNEKFPSALRTGSDANTPSTPTTPPSRLTCPSHYTTRSTRSAPSCPTFIWHRVCLTSSMEAG